MDRIPNSGKRVCPVVEQIFQDYQTWQSPRKTKILILLQKCKINVICVKVSIVENDFWIRPRVAKGIETSSLITSYHWPRSSSTDFCPTSQSSLLIWRYRSLGQRKNHPSLLKMSSSYCIFLKNWLSSLSSWVRVSNRSFLDIWWSWRCCPVCVVEFPLDVEVFFFTKIGGRINLLTRTMNGRSVRMWSVNERISSRRIFTVRGHSFWRSRKRNWNVKCHGYFAVTDFQRYVEFWTRQAGSQDIPLAQLTSISQVSATDFDFQTFSSDCDTSCRSVSGSKSASSILTCRNESNSVVFERKRRRKSYVRV